MKAHQIPTASLDAVTSVVAAAAASATAAATAINTGGDTRVESFPSDVSSSSSNNHRLKEDDELELAEYCRQWRIDRFVALPNFRDNLRTLLPPSGFVASFAKDAVVPAALFEGVPLFMRVSLFRVATPWTSATIPRDTANAIRTKLQLFLRDNSPAPPSLKSRAQGWTCSLGPGGAAGFYSFTAKRPQWYIMVRCGLDRATNEQVFEELREAERNGQTLADMVRDPNGLFATIDGLVADNAARIAATLARAAGPGVYSIGQGDQTLTPQQCVPFYHDDDDESDDDENEYDDDENEPDDDDDDDDDDDVTQARRSQRDDDKATCSRVDIALRWLSDCGVGGDDTPIPAWFCVPRGGRYTPAGVPEAPELVQGFPLGRVLARRRRRQTSSSSSTTFPSRPVLVADEALMSEVTCTWNVVKKNEEKTFFYNGCTPYSSHAKPVFAWDLFQNIEVHRWRNAGGDLVTSATPSMPTWAPPVALAELVTVPVTFDPIMTRKRTLGNGNEHIHFWLDAEYTPIDVAHAFPESDDVARKFGVGETRIYLTPALVRHSMARPSGVVVPPATTLARLRVLLHEDDDYDPIA